MALSSISLNALRAFEAAARHLSFTRAGLELSVSQAAISHQIKGLEERLGTPLFLRTSRGLLLTDEGAALVPTLTRSFEDMGRLLEQISGGQRREVLTVSVVGTFAVWVMSRLPAFEAAHPFVDLRLFTNNNRVDLAGDSLDYGIRFGDGAWHGTEAVKIKEAPFAPLCSPRVAARLITPADLAGFTLLRSYRTRDWPVWLEKVDAVGVVARGTQFDSSWIMVEAAIRGDAVALAPVAMFEEELASGRVVQPFPQSVDLGAYWITNLISRPVTPAMLAFRSWLLDEVGPLNPAGDQGAV